MFWKTSSSPNSRKQRPVKMLIRQLLEEVAGDRSEELAKVYKIKVDLLGGQTLLND